MSFSVVVVLLNRALVCIIAHLWTLVGPWPDRVAAPVLTARTLDSLQFYSDWAVRVHWDQLSMRVKCGMLAAIFSR